MFSRILVANRGEIALRVIRACQELGIKSVAIFSEADRDAVYLDMADDAVCIGPASAAKSYLDIPRILSVAEIASVDAIHPGYGFLAENAHFADICKSHKIGFIGPDPETIRLLGDKARARRMADEVGVPCTPGSDVLKSEQEAIDAAERVGYPVILKASAGGGGKGMRVAHNQASLITGLHQARVEAKAAFKNDEVYLEKLIERPRHIEFQILADAYGNVVHLGERDCSLQRRHQKLLEESPSPGLSPELRTQMGDAACKLARAANYVSAGTVEFLLDRTGTFYFMEVNARIQVEHPVTEMVTGLDLIKRQMLVCSGERLDLSQDDVTFSGHAIECRINAEDPDNDFRPSPGTIERFFAPGGRGVRFDSHVMAGYTIPPNYDSMIGKVIVHGADRTEAIRLMRRALAEMVVDGVKTTIPLFLDLFTHARFLSGEVDTAFIEQFLDQR